MGRLFTLPPSPYEVDHAAAIKAGLAYQAEHAGELPDTPAWRMLERRYDINPMRFTANHRNIAPMIERDINARTIDKPDIFPINRCSPYQGGTCEPPRGGGTHPQVVPEPASIVLGLAAVVAWLTWRAWRP